MSSISKQLSSITCTVRRPPPPPSLPEIRMVVVGKTGSGKSSSANTILGRKVFDTRVSSASVTVRCRRANGEYRGRRLMLLDTPGLLDTHQAPQEVLRELRRSVSLLYPGPHVFLIAVNVGRFGQEEREAVRRIKQAVGSQALRFSVVLFTHGDLLEEGASVRQCLLDKCADLDRLVEECGGRYCVFNNRSSKTKEQVAELFGLVDSLVRANEGSYYSINSLQKAEEDLERELEQREAAFRQKQEAAVKEWCDKGVRAVREENAKEVEEMKRQQELERQNLENVAREREEAFKREVDEGNRREKERKIQEMVRVMEIRREEEKKREELREKLDKATKLLGERAEQEQRTKRTAEEMIQRERTDLLAREREREVQHIQREQATRRREEAKREALQTELDKLLQSLEEQSRREEEGRRLMEAELQQEKQEHRREREAQAEKEAAERRRSEALRQELSEVAAELERQAAHEQALQRRLEENLRRERERHRMEASMLGKPCGKRTGEGGGRGVVTAVGGYAQEMGLMGLNAALESTGASCSVQ